MNKKKCKIFGVIAANAADIEQREILSGIIENAEKFNADVIVISNIYNPIDTAPALEKENCIYDRIASPLFDGFILISESIINKDLQAKILSQLCKQNDIPIIVLGTPQPGFELSNFKVINTSDENDFEAITDHLIEVHGYTEIDILSGHEFIDASKNRVEGYRRSLEKHNIKYDDSRVHYGDFWTTSGRSHAKKYINGELKYPHVLICCNDYMAYGVLDEFMEQKIPINEKMAVIGYEYIRERHAHTPLLSTYQRNRKSLGKAAIDILMGQNIEDFVPESGRIIEGETCGCHGQFSDISYEMKNLQTKEMYDFLNLFSQLEHRLTECRNITEFVAKCWDFQFMIRNFHKLYLCLYENWYDNSPNVDNMIRYNLQNYEEPVIFHKNDFDDFIIGEPSAYYLCPLFFADRELGYVVVCYNCADTFDHIFRNWLKSIANGLELLRMKNDIRYLSACQNLSEKYDNLTSMLNENGIKTAYLSANSNKLCLVMLQYGLFDAKLSSLNINEKIDAILDAAEAVKEFCGNNKCARIHDNTFICFVNYNVSDDFCTDLLSSSLYQHKKYMKKYGVDSFVCAVKSCHNKSFDEILKECEDELQNKISVISARRRDKKYQSMLNIRNMIYNFPNTTFDTNKLHSKFKSSTGYLRITYKKIFNISFHQDCILSRLAKAKYLLAVNDMNIQEVAFNCGYSDYKYFMRQFVQSTGMTAKFYREQANELSKCL